MLDVYLSRTHHWGSRLAFSSQITGNIRSRRDRTATNSQIQSQSETMSLFVAQVTLYDRVKWSGMSRWEDWKMERQNRKMERQDRIMERQDRRMERQDRRMERQDRKMERQDRRMERQDRRMERQDRRMERQDRRMERQDSSWIITYRRPHRVTSGLWVTHSDCFYTSLKHRWLK